MSESINDLKIGVLGGGQLGRMMIQSAINYNLDISILDPHSNAPCAHLTANFQVGRLTDRDIKQDTLSNAGNTNPLGLWSDGTMIWVVNNASGESSSDKIFAYTLADGSRDKDKEINTLNAAGSNVPIGLWSDGTTIRVSDIVEDKIFAYTLSDGSRDAAKDINTLNSAGNNRPNGLWSEGTTLYISDRSSKLFAYTLSGGARNAARDIESITLKITTIGIWSDKTTLWVNNGVGVRAFRLEQQEGFVSMRDFLSNNNRSAGSIISK